MMGVFASYVARLTCIFIPTRTRFSRFPTGKSPDRLVRRALDGRATPARAGNAALRMFEAVLEEHAAKQARLKEDAGTSPRRALPPRSSPFKSRVPAAPPLRRVPDLPASLFPGPQTRPAAPRSPR